VAFQHCGRVDRRERQLLSLQAEKPSPLLCPEAFVPRAATPPPDSVQVDPEGRAEEQSSMNHWTEFEEEYLEMSDSPVPQPESLRPCLLVPGRTLLLRCRAPRCVAWRPGEGAGATASTRVERPAAAAAGCSRATPAAAALGGTRRGVSREPAVDLEASQRAARGPRAATGGCFCVVDFR
jgi:hypothetical protein